MPDTNRLLEAALDYAAKKLEVFPVNERTKAPYTTNGMKDATNDTATITGWWHDHPHALIGCRIPESTIILDVDPRHGGADTWAELERSYAPIAAGRIHASGRGDGGQHHWFRRPVGKLSAKALHDWARNNGVGQAVGQKSWSSGIDILHNGHRYTILPPSPHPDTGKPYLWVRETKPDDVPAFLQALIITGPAPVSSPSMRIVRDTDSIADWYTVNHSWHDILPAASWQLVEGDGDHDGSKWRHPNASAASSASIRHGCLFIYSPNTDFDVTEDGDPHGITRFRAWAILEHGGDMSAAASEARTRRDGTTRRSHATVTGEIVLATFNLPDEFWNARPALQHIRQAAHSRTRSADAVLAFVLARVATLIPPTTTLPPIVGSAASLNHFGAVVASSGGGKSSAKDVAGELVPITFTDILDDIPLGSGEGLTEAFFEFVTEEDDDGKTRKVTRQTKRAAFVYLDEGQALAEMGNRKGSTLLSTLRSAWSGSTIGQQNASVETHRRLGAHRYRLALMVGFQLEYATALVDDAAGGTPQRFVFSPATDPTIPDIAPDWPGPLTFEIPPIILDGKHIDIATTVAEGIRARQLAAQRGQLHIDPLDTHGDLVRLKVATLLGILDNRDNTTEADWELAGQIMHTSRSVRAWILEEARLKRRLDEQRRQDMAGRFQLAVSDTVAGRSLERAATAIGRRAHRDPETVCTRRDFTQAIASRDRTNVTVDEATEHATQMLWITPVEGGWTAGKAKPV
jgi:hypothetical protein